MEDSPHHLRVVDLALVVSDVQTEDDLIELGVLNSDALVAQRRRQIFEEVWQSIGLHFKIASWVVLGPGVLEGLDIFLLESKNIILILCSLVVAETLTNDCDKDIHENEESHELVNNPEHDGDQALNLHATVHDTIPRLTSRGSPQGHQTDVEAAEIHILVDEFSIVLD